MMEYNQITEKDLAEIANVDVNEYGLNMLKAGTDLSDYTPEQLAAMQRDKEEREKAAKEATII